MSVHVWSCRRCGATGPGADSAAAHVAGLEHYIEAHPFDGEADISVAVAW